MAIQMRRGDYADFDDRMMAAGEFAFVQSGDPDSVTGQRVYACFAPGDVQKLVTDEEMQAAIGAYLEDDATYAPVIAQKVEEAIEEHPEWASTVADGSLTAVKFAADVTTFTEASSRANISSGEGIKTIWGKIKKWFSDLKAGAFSAVANNLTTTTEGSVLDARQGKALNDAKFDKTGGTISGNLVITKTTPCIDLNATNIAGRLVASDTSNRFGLWSLSKSKYLIFEDTNGVVHVPPVDVKSSITLTKSDNCSAVTLVNAYRVGNVLFIKFQVTPVSNLSSADNVDIEYSGFTPAITSDYRLNPGIIGVGLYMAWIMSSDTIRCRYMSSNAWATNNSPIFTGVIPLTTS